MGSNNDFAVKFNSTLDLLRKHYLIVTVFLSILIFLSCIKFYSFLAHQSKMSYAIELVGKQQFLTQKIANQSSLHVMRRDSALKNLETSVKEFSENINKIKESGILSSMSKTDRNYLKNGVNDFDLKMENYLKEIEDYMNTPLKSKTINSKYSKVVFQSNESIANIYSFLISEFRQKANNSKIVLGFIMSINFLLCFLFLNVYNLLILRPVLSQLIESEATIEQYGRVDSLTKISNRKEFVRLGEIEVYRSRRFSKPLSLFVIDIDHFKNFNEKYGHSTGDKMLVSFAECLTNNVRNIDLTARLSGGEFAILLPETNLSQAILLADRIRGIIASENFSISNSKNTQITISIGIASVTVGNDNNSIELAIKDATANLFFAKQAGRNAIMPEAA